MSGPELRQRLTSILAADVAGYSKLMGRDERATVAALDAARKVFREEIESRDGRVVDMVGDSVLAAFDSAAGAVAAAIAIQETLHRASVGVDEERRMRFRIGVHLGDVFEKADGTIYGDGVNIAARLEGLADPGGIAVSDAVEGAVRGRLAVRTQPLGPQRVKNVSHPLQAHRVDLPWVVRSASSAARPTWLTRFGPRTAAAVLVGATVALGVWFEGSWHARRHDASADGRITQDDRSVAVLPFVDLSEAKDQSYFSDGLSEEVISRLARTPQLRVIARTSSFAFKDSHANAAVIARELNVATLLEGSVRRSADRVRVSAQLVRASDSTYLWSGTYERSLNDVFAIQDEIAAAVVTALEIKLDHPSQSSGTTRHHPLPEAYDQYLLGRQLMRTRPDHYPEQAVEAFSRAVALDGTYAAAHAMRAFAISFVAEDEPEPNRRRALMDAALAAADKAVELDPDEADALATRGYLRFESGWDFRGADADLRRALELDPNAEPALTQYGFFLRNMGRNDEALALAQKLKATDPFFAPPWELESLIQATRGDYAAAADSIRHARSILQRDPNSGEALARLALLKGEPERAKALFEKVSDPAHRDWGLAMAEHDLGRVTASQKFLQAFIAKSPFEYYILAAAYSRTQDLDSAFTALERAYDTRDPALLDILADPLLEGLRGDPRYARLIARMGFPDPPARRAGAPVTKTPS